MCEVGATLNRSTLIDPRAVRVLHKVFLNGSWRCLDMLRIHGRVSWEGFQLACHEGATESPDRHGRLNIPRIGIIKLTPNFHADRLWHGLRGKPDPAKWDGLLCAGGRTP
jgi:hypothetical protein